MYLLLTTLRLNLDKHSHCAATSEKCILSILKSNFNQYSAAEFVDKLEV